MNDQSTPLPESDVELLADVAQGYSRLRDEIGKVIIGQEDVIRALLAATFAQGHALIIGVPGLAKTLLVKTLASALGWSFKRIQFTPDMMPADIIGMELLHEHAGEREMRFMRGPIFANLILADEINRTPPKTQAALLEAMQEYTVTSMGHSHTLEQPFVVVATQNPIEQEGTYPLPEAQLDRFMFSLWIDYPSVDEEEAIVAATTVPRDAQVSQVFEKSRMQDYQRLVRRIPVSQHVISYAVAIARGTRPNDALADDYVKRYVEWGAGPRAGQNLVLGAKAMAALDGEPTVSANHVRQVAPHVLRHRILANYNATGEGVTTQQIVEHIVQTVAEPIYA